MIIAIAHDDAFNFTYRANIDALAQLGEIIYFSPLQDDYLPKCNLLYLPGGYPELYAKTLSANTTMRNTIKEYIEGGGMAFAECGGFMYLCHDIDGEDMCNVFDLKATMQNARLHLGYRKAIVSGTELRGHEFHYSDILPTEPSANVQVIHNQLTAKGEKAKTNIYRYKNAIAGYTHWYWAEHGFENTWLKELRK